MNTKFYVDAAFLLLAFLLILIPCVELVKDHREERKRRQRDMEDERSGR